jgi:hypothetical protein
MRKVLIFGVPALLAAQSSTATYTRDVNGNRQEISPTSRSNGDRTERSTSPNGRRAPIDQSSEKVLKDDASGKTVEKTIQRYDGTGRVSQTIKVLVEETKLPGGGSVVRETSSQADLSGRFVPTERRTTETRVSGQTTTASTTLDKPNVNGGYQTVEKRNSVTTGPKGNEQTTETVDRPDTGGRFQTVGRTETAKKTTAAGSSENTASYEVDPTTGRMVLAGQKVVNTTKRPGGGEAVETSVYGRNSTGNISDSGKLLIKEQQVLEKRLNSDGTVVETLTVRRPTISDPSVLGAPRQVSETVCTGKCLATADTATPGTPALAKPTAPASSPQPGGPGSTTASTAGSPAKK